MVDVRSDDQKRTDAYAEESHRVEKAYELLFGDGDDYDYGDDDAPKTFNGLCDTFGLTPPVDSGEFDRTPFEARWNIYKQFLPDVVDSVTLDRQRELREHVNETFAELNVPEGLREKEPEGKISPSYEVFLNNVKGRERETEGPEL